MKVKAIIIDGFHQGETLDIPYSRVIKLLIPASALEAQEVGSDDWYQEQQKEYIECFRSVDGTTVLYSTTGRADDIQSFYQARIVMEKECPKL